MPVDVTFNIPLPLRRHSDWCAGAKRNLVWLAERGLINSQTAHLYDLFKSETLVGYTFPYATSHGLDMANRIISVCTILDDQFDGPAGRDPTAARQVSESFIALLDPSTSAAVEDPSPLHKAFAEVWRDSCEGKSPMWHTRAAESWRRYFSSLVHEAGNRRRDGFLPLDCYLEQRLVTGAMQQFTDACEVAGEFEVPPVAFNIPQLRIMRTLTADFVNLANDLASLEKEIVAGETDNLVMVIRNERGCDIDEAIKLAHRFVEGKVTRFAELQPSIPVICESLALSPDEIATVDRYVEALAAWISGYERWQRETFRYRAAGRLNSATGSGYCFQDLLGHSERLQHHESSPN
ncbi:hypothetical protein J5X84_18165 [Streptosporangiaceae bacterium NEAU-GS5]|nr:hypothetical protein [Streptosporangiaceae bacterium NEAU-GS5]